MRYNCAAMSFHDRLESGIIEVAGGDPARKLVVPNTIMAFIYM